jgi:hypothetical protein
LYTFLLFGLENNIVSFVNVNWQFISLHTWVNVLYRFI